MHRDEFSVLMTQMRACYPSVAKDSALWEGTVRAYWAALRHFDREVIRVAMSLALSKHPQWFPTASQLTEIARERARSRAVREKADDACRALPRPDERPDPYGPGNPPEHKDQLAEYVKAGKTPFERLARMWECETKALGLTSNSSTPIDVGKRRWPDFWKTWEKAVEA